MMNCITTHITQNQGEKLTFTHTFSVGKVSKSHNDIPGKSLSRSNLRCNILSLSIHQHAISSMSAEVTENHEEKLFDAVI